MSVAQAKIMDADLRGIQSRGVSQARVVGASLRALAVRSFTSRRPRVRMRETIWGAIGPTMVDAMTVSYLRGREKSYQLAGLKPRVLQLSVYDAVLSVLTRRATIDVGKLQKKLKTRALKIVNDVSARTEKELYSSIADMIREGVPTVRAVEMLDDEFDRLGLSPKNDFQLETIYRTQTQLMYGAGRWQADQDPDIQEILWGYKYVTVGDDRVRPEHDALDGVTLPKDDDFWQEFWPPNGYNCRCQAIPMFEERSAVRPPDETDDGDPVEPDDGFDFNIGEELSLAWDESQHPRDEKGRFGDSAAAMKVERLLTKIRNADRGRSEAQRKKWLDANKELNDHMASMTTKERREIKDKAHKLFLKASKTGDHEVWREALGVKSYHPELSRDKTSASKEDVNLVADKITAEHKDAIAGFRDNASSKDVAQVKEWTRRWKQDERVENQTIRDIRDSEADGRPSKEAKAFNQMLDYAPEYKGVAFRGINLDEDSVEFEKFTTPGSKITFKSSSSMSRDPDVAANYGNVVMRITSKTGADISAHEIVKNKEVVARAGTKYQVTKVHPVEYISIKGMQTKGTGARLTVVEMKEL